jgi:hypothetical protein
VKVGNVTALTSTATATTIPLATTFGTSVALEDPGAGSNKVTVQAPSGLAASYTVTLPPTHPADVGVLTWNSVGTTAVAKITNSYQDFGTPSAATDVAIKSYVDSDGNPATTLTTAWSSLTAGGGVCSGTAAYVKSKGIVYLRGSITSSSTSQNCTLSTFAAGSRPSTDAALIGTSCTLAASTGVITCTGMSNTTFNLSGVSFPAEQ